MTRSGRVTTPAPSGWSATRLAVPATRRRGTQRRPDEQGTCRAGQCDDDDEHDGLDAEQSGHGLAQVIRRDPHDQHPALGTAGSQQPVRPRVQGLGLGRTSHRQPQQRGGVGPVDGRWPIGDGVRVLDLAVHDEDGQRARGQARHLAELTVLRGDATARDAGRFVAVLRRMLEALVEPGAGGGQLRVELVEQEPLQSECRRCGDEHRGHGEQEHDARGEPQLQGPPPESGTRSGLRAGVATHVAGLST